MECKITFVATWTTDAKSGSEAGVKFSELIDRSGLRGVISIDSVEIVQLE